MNKFQKKALSSPISYDKNNCVVPKNATQKEKKNYILNLLLYVAEGLDKEGFGWFWCASGSIYCKKRKRLLTIDEWSERQQIAMAKFIIKNMKGVGEREKTEMETTKITFCYHIPLTKEELIKLKELKEKEKSND